MTLHGKQIFFHVGLGKAASKFLQHKIFPQLKGIYYIKPTRYKQCVDLIHKLQKPKILVSREFDNQLEEETGRFATHFPDARIIIIFRRHDTWLASQYRRHIKNGNSCTFEEFIDVTHDRGKWRRDKIFFMPKLKHLETLFGRKPLVLFYDDLIADPKAFINALADFLEAECDTGKVSLKPHHTSYSDKQLKVMRKVGRYFFNQADEPLSPNPVLSWLQRRGRLLGCYIILYIAWLIPGFLIEDEELIPKESLEKVRRFYEEDWSALGRYYAVSKVFN